MVAAACVLCRFHPSAPELCYRFGVVTSVTSSNLQAYFGFLPHPGVPKSLTREQLQGRKEKAVRFVTDVLQNPDRAEEIADESLEDYAERRKITLTNSLRKQVMATKQELLDQIADLQDENQ